MASPPWFRFYSETLRDRKVEHICRATNQPKALVVGAWATILAIASDSPVRGVLLLTDDIPFTLDDIAGEMGLDITATTGIIDQFVRFQMVHLEGDVYHLTNWDRRQFTSDSSTERVRQHRERQKEALQEAECNSDETLQECDGNLPDTDTDTDTESDTEQIQNKHISAFLAIRKAWIDLMPDKPRPRENNNTLRSKVKTRMKDDYFRDNWRAALERAAKSSFLGESGFFDLGWFLKNDDNWQKCLNGNYDDKGNGPNGSGVVRVGT